MADNEKDILSEEGAKVISYMIGMLVYSFILWIVTFNVAKKLGLELESRFLGSKESILGITSINKFWVFLIPLFFSMIVPMFFADKKNKNREPFWTGEGIKRIWNPLNLSNLFAITIWWFLLFTLLLINIKKLSNLATASDNTILILVWGILFFGVIQVISKNYLHTKCTETKQRGSLHNLYKDHKDDFNIHLKNKWPIVCMTITLLILLFILYVVNFNNISEFMKFWLVPTIAFTTMVIIGFVWKPDPILLSGQKTESNNSGAPIIINRESTIRNEFTIPAME